MAASGDMAIGGFLPLLLTLDVGAGGGAAVRSSVALSLGIGLASLAVIAVAVVLGVRAVLRGPAARAALAILSAALVLHVVLAFAAPYGTGDEIVNFSSALTAAFANLDLVIYPHPALYFDLGAGCLGVAAGAVALLQGLPLDEAALRVAALHSTDVLIACRCVSALAWTGVLAVVHASTVALGGRAWAGLLAMLLVLSADLLYTPSFSPYPLGVLLASLAVHHVAFARPDRPVDPPWAALAGLLFGLGLACHYLVLLFTPVALAPLFGREWRRPVISVAAFAGILLLAFVAANPRLFLSLPDYLAFWGYRVSEVSTFDVQNVHDSSPGTALGGWFYLAMLAGRVLGPLFLLGGGLAAARWIRTRDSRLPTALLLAAWLLAVFSAAATKYYQYLLFLVPPLAVVAAIGLSELAGWPASRRLGRSIVALALLAGLWDAAWPAALAIASLPGRRPLVSASPESVFLREVRDLPSGDRVGVSSPTLALPRLAATERRVPAAVSDRLGAIVSQAAGRPVSWVDVLADGSARGLSGVDWMYVFDWVGRDATARPRTPAGCDPVRQGREGGVAFSLCRVAPSAGPAAVSAPGTAPAPAPVPVPGGGS